MILDYGLFYQKEHRRKRHSFSSHSGRGTLIRYAGSATIGLVLYERYLVRGLQRNVVFVTRLPAVGGMRDTFRRGSGTSIDYRELLIYKCGTGNIGLVCCDFSSDRLRAWSFFITSTSAIERCFGTLVLV